MFLGSLALQRFEQVSYSVSEVYSECSVDAAMVLAENFADIDACKKIRADNELLTKSKPWEDCRHCMTVCTTVGERVGAKLVSKLDSELKPAVVGRDINAKFFIGFNLRSTDITGAIAAATSFDDGHAIKLGRALKQLGKTTSGNSSAVVKNADLAIAGVDILKHSGCFMKLICANPDELHNKLLSYHSSGTIDVTTDSKYVEQVCSRLQHHGMQAAFQAFAAAVCKDISEEGFLPDVDERIREAKAEVANIYFLFLNFLKALAVATVDVLEKVAPDWKSHASSDDDAPALSGDKVASATKEILNNDNRDWAQIMPLVTALRSIETAFTKIHGLVQPENIGLSSSQIESLSKIWPADFTTEVERQEETSKSVIGIAAYLDWYNLHSANMGAQSAQDALKAAAEVITLKGFFVPSCVQKLVGFS